jgi:TRAP-type transport system small permease protein
MMGETATSSASAGPISRVSASTWRAPWVLAGRALDTTVSSLGLVAALSLLLLPALITADVLMRFLRFGNIKWVVDVSEYILFLSTYLAAPWLLRLGLHVRIDVLLAVSPPALARRFEQLLDATGVLICGTLTYYGFAAALDAYQLGLKQYKTITVPDWPFHVVFTVAMLLMSIEFVRRIARPDAAIATKDLTVGV